MKYLPIFRIFGVGLLTALVLLTAGRFFVAATQSKPTITIMTLGTRTCDALNQPKPAITQSEQFVIEVRGLATSEPVAINLTFPDGRVFSPTVAQVEGRGGLDGIVDTPTDPGFFGQTNAGGTYVNFFQTTSKWPHGCYKVTAQGVTSQIQASEYLVVEDAPIPQPEAGPLTLEVQSHVDQQTSGEQGVTVDIAGRAFLGGEVITLQMIQPNGTIIDLPAPPVSPLGTFQTSVDLSDDHQVGDHTFVATNSTQHRVSAIFTLHAKVVRTSGPVAITLTSPVAAAPVQGQSLQLQGKLFDADAQVTCRVVQPNGAIRTLRVVQANSLGEFTADLPLDRQLPTGDYTFLASSNTALSSLTFHLTAGSHVVPANAVIVLNGNNSTGLFQGTSADSTPSPVVISTMVSTATATVSPVATTATPTPTEPPSPPTNTPPEHNVIPPAPATPTTEATDSGVNATPPVPIGSPAPPTPMF